MRWREKYLRPSILPVLSVQFITNKVRSTGNNMSNEGEGEREGEGSEDR